MGFFDDFKGLCDVIKDVDRCWICIGGCEGFDNFCLRLAWDESVGAVTVELGNGIVTGELDLNDLADEVEYFDVCDIVGGAGGGGEGEDEVENVLNSEGLGLNDFLP